MSEVFKDAFTLMNASGEGTITLEEIYSFTDTLTPKPNHEKVRRIYNEFDADGSGDIDSEEFLGLCQALEKLTNSTVDEMAKTYSTSCYRRLFELVDDGSGPIETATISKEELKVFLDSSALQVSSGDVVQIFKEYVGELDFHDFQQVVKRIIRGKSIAQVLMVFEDMKLRRKKAKWQALDMFEDPEVAKRKRREAAVNNPRDFGGSSTTSQPRSIASTHHQTSEEMFAECFTLMDSRGGGVLNLDSIYEFCETLPQPPSQATVRKLYNQFDEDGSGDIDSEEFLGFCKALEKVTKLATAEMCQHYSAAMYRRLFELVDDGGDGNDSVSKDELKTLLEAISPLLSSKYTAADVFALVREFTGELNFDEFCGVIKKLTVGKSISQVVTAFEEAIRRRKAAKHFALSKFEGKQPKKEKQEDPSSSPTQGERLCFGCMEKEQQIRELQQEVEILRAELSQLKGGAAAETHEKSVRQLMNEDDPHGNPFANIRSVQDLGGSAYYRKYPELIKPALHFNQSSRLVKLAEFFEVKTQGSTMQTDIIVREMNEAVPEILDLQKQLQAVFDPILNDYLTSITLQHQLLQQMILWGESNDSAPLKETFDLLESYRTNMKSLRPDASWIVDSIIEKRSDISIKGLCIAPYTSKSAMITAAVHRLEEDTQHLLDMSTGILMHGSDQLSDVEIVAKRIINGARTSIEQSEMDSMNDILMNLEDNVSAESVARMFDGLTRTIEGLKRNISVSTSAKRDKGMMTMPMIDQPLNLKLKQVHEDPAAKADATQSLELTMRSNSPRMRMKTAKPRDTIAHVDKVLDQYIQSKGVNVPSNFQRAEAGTNMFLFGTKKIELIPVDKFAAVKVGGGYLLFDEFCAKYCAAENRKFVVKEQRPETEIIKSFATTPRAQYTPRSSMHTPRSHGGSSRGTTPRSTTPRTLVRSGRGLNII